jgi:ATP-dependent DNA helicase RecQ
MYKRKKACKSRLILNYFGENTITNCGSCSYCITKKVKKEEDNGLSYEILTLLKSEDLNSREIQFKTKKTTDEIIFALQQLLEMNKIAIKSNNKYTLLS